MCWARRAWKNNIQSILTFRVAQWLKNKLLLRTDCKMEAVSQMSDTADVGSVSTGSYRDGTPGSGPLIITMKIGAELFQPPHHSLFHCHYLPTNLTASF